MPGDAGSEGGSQALGPYYLTGRVHVPETDGGFACRNRRRCFPHRRQPGQQASCKGAQAVSPGRRYRMSRTRAGSARASRGEVGPQPIVAEMFHETDPHLIHPAAARPFRPVRGRVEGQGARCRDRGAPAGGERVPGERGPGHLHRSRRGVRDSRRRRRQPYPGRQLHRVRGVPPPPSRSGGCRRPARRAGARGVPGPGDRRRSRPGPAAGNTGRLLGRPQGGDGPQARLPGPAADSRRHAGCVRHRAGRRLRRFPHQRQGVRPAQRRRHDQRRAGQRHGERLGLLVQLRRARGRDVVNPGAAGTGGLEPRHRLGRRHPQHHHRHRRGEARIPGQAGGGEQRLLQDQGGPFLRVNERKNRLRSRADAQDGRRPSRSGMGIGLVLFRCPELPGFRHAQDRSVRRRRPAAARTAPLQAADRHLRWRLRPLPGDRRHGLGKPRRNLQSQLGAVAVLVLPGALQRQAPRRARQRRHHGARELLPQAAGQPQLVLDARGAADPVQRLLLLPRKGGRHRAPGSQPRPAGRRQHRLAAGRGRAQHPHRGGSGPRPGGWRGSGGKRNRRANRPPQLGQPPLLVRIPGDSRIPSEAAPSSWRSARTCDTTRASTGASCATFSAPTTSSIPGTPTRRPASSGSETRSPSTTTASPAGAAVSRSSRGGSET